MQFVKKILLGFGAFLLIFGGGAGTQSKSMLLQGGGFIGLLIGLVVLYLFLRMVWRAMGCLPSFMIFAGISLFILYAIGGFNGGINHMGHNLKQFLGQDREQQFSQKNMQRGSNIISAQTKAKFIQASENFNSPESTPSQFYEQRQARTSPLDRYPLIKSNAHVIMGSLLNIQGYYFKLFGVDSPDLDQSCSGKNKTAYNCGKMAASWLRDWILDYELECRVMKQDAKGNMAGVCFLGQYDIGAALVEAGWALATAQIYVPYEQKAKQNRNGLWSGTFYRPADWRVLKKQKPNIKIIKPKDPNKKGLWGF